MNPVKIDSVKQAVLKSFPGRSFTFEGVDAPSGVPDQPWGDDQTLLGARNRVHHIARHDPEALLVALGACSTQAPQTWDHEAGHRAGGFLSSMRCPSRVCHIDPPPPPCQRAAWPGSAMGRPPPVARPLAAWAVVQVKGREGRARSASFLLPPEVARLVESGMELGDADDQVRRGGEPRGRGGKRALGH